MYFLVCWLREKTSRIFWLIQNENRFVLFSATRTESFEKKKKINVNIFCFVWTPSSKKKDSFLIHRATKKKKKSFQLGNKKKDSNKGRLIFFSSGQEFWDKSKFYNSEHGNLRKWRVGVKVERGGRERWKTGEKKNWL